MSLHTAKAHFSNAQNYAKTEFEKQLAQGLIALAAAIGEKNRDTEAALRALQQTVQAGRKA